MPNAEPERSRYIVFDTESIPDGDLLSKVKFPNDRLSCEEAVARAQEEARQASRTGSDFINVSFQIPVAVCTARVGDDFHLQSVTCLDAPKYRTEEIVRIFWNGVARHNSAKLVTINGRGFDLPMLELAGFRYGINMQSHLHRNRDRYRGDHLDLLDWFTNHRACTLAGGLNLLAKLINKPGKMEVAGDQVYRFHCEGRIQEINDYCLCDTLDTYFVFLRTRVMTGDMTLEREGEVVRKAREFLEAKSSEMPVLSTYLQGWS